MYYYCKWCGKTVDRSSRKAWIKSYCDSTGKTVHLIRIEKNMTGDVNGGKLTKNLKTTYERYYPEGSKRREERKEYMKLYMRDVRKKAKKKRAAHEQSS